MDNAGVNKYLDMQRVAYEHPDRDLEWHKYNVVTRPESSGVFEDAYGDFEYTLFFGSEDHTQSVALDFGCGVGRMIANWRNKFYRIDGVDMSSSCIQATKDHLAQKEIDAYLYVCNGYNLAGVPASIYDVVYSCLCLEHICVHDIRDSYFREFYRVLKNGGIIALSMKGASSYPSDDTRYRMWYDNYYDAPVTNSGCDVGITNLFDVANDLADIGFKSPQFTLHRMNPDPVYDVKHTHQVIIRAQK